MATKRIMGYEVEVPDPEPTLLDKIRQHKPSVQHTFKQPPTRFNLQAVTGRRRG